MKSGRGDNQYICNYCKYFIWSYIWVSRFTPDGVAFVSVTCEHKQLDWESCHVPILRRSLSTWGFVQYSMRLNLLMSKTSEQFNLHIHFLPTLQVCDITLIHTPFYAAWLLNGLTKLVIDLIVSLWVVAVSVTLMLRFVQTSWGLLLLSSDD